MATDSLKTLQALAQLSGDDRTKIVTESINEIEDSAELDQLIQRIKVYIQQHAGKRVTVDGEPPKTVFPDYTHDMFPLVPVVIGLKVIEVQKIFRVKLVKTWAFQGGQGRFPWELVSADIDSWIPAHRRPAGATIADPSTMRLSLCLVWINWFHDKQTGVLPLECRTQMSRVFAGLSPIDASLSQESSRRLEVIPHQNKETWGLEFTETVTRCHAPGGMTYSPTSIEYAKYIRRNPAALSVSSATLSVSSSASSLALCRPPEFLELPTGESLPTAMIDGQEKALLLEWAGELPELLRTYVVELIDAINAHQAHLPASTPDGIWVGQYANSMPALLPSSPNTLVQGLQLFTKFWLPIGFYTASVLTELTSCIPYLHMFFRDMLVSPLIIHKPSGTLIGDYNGFVGLSLPSGYDLAHLPSDELTQVLSWARQFTDLLQASTAILAKTSDDCRSFKPPTQPQDPVAGPSQSPALPTIDPLPPSPALPTSGACSRTSSSPPTRTRAPKHKDRQPHKRKQNAQTDEPMSKGVSDVSVPKQDYDGMDGHSDDSDDLNPDGYSPDLLGGGVILRWMAMLTGLEVTRTGLAAQSVACKTSMRTYLDQAALIRAASATYLVPSFLFPQHPRNRSPHPMKLSAHAAQRKHDVQAAQQAAGSFPTLMQPLISFALARRHGWQHAETDAPLVIDLVPRMALAARQALQLDTAIVDFWEIGGRANAVGDVERDTLKKLHQQLLKGAIELCWIYKELLAFEKLST
ncbi:hypothetical protein FRC06_008163, partial [Ceratobasidium sp. 370]